MSTASTGGRFWGGTRPSRRGRATETTSEPDQPLTLGAIHTLIPQAERRFEV